MTAKKKRKRATKKPASNDSRSRTSLGKRSNKRNLSSTAYQAVPPEIRPLMSQRHILPSEDPKLYDALFGHIASVVKPVNALQWLDVKKLQDLYWEQMRLSRIKPGIIQSAQREVLASLFNLMPGGHVLEHTSIGTVRRGERNALDWFLDPAVKEKLEELLDKFGYTQNTIDAMAFVEKIDEIAAFDQMEMSREMLQTAIRNRLDEEQHVLQLQPVTDDNRAPVQPQLEHQENSAEQCVAEHEAEEADPQAEEDGRGEAESGDDSIERKADDENAQSEAGDDVQDDHQEQAQSEDEEHA